MLPNLSSLPPWFDLNPESSSAGSLIKHRSPADSSEILRPVERSLEEIGLAQPKDNPSLRGSPFSKSVCESGHASFSVEDNTSSAI